MAINASTNSYNKLIEGTLPVGLRFASAKLE